ncbi:uncharacterized protein [Musca autumnalis]|uniref:uncharacterized protein n=1 Tax=Musca autumnalis TaxID=221902 RepID=UPI003CEE7F1D
MFKFAVVIFAVIACAAAKPGLVTPLAYTAPAAVVAAAPAPFVTATSSQYVARNYNGIATAPVVAKTFAAPVVAKTFAAAYTAPVTAAYSAPVVTKYAATYAAPFGYSAPLTYAAAPAPVFL